jgi:hypothetical protein
MFLWSDEHHAKEALSSDGGSTPCVIRFVTVIRLQTKLWQEQGRSKSDRADAAGTARCIVPVAMGEQIGAHDVTERVFICWALQLWTDAREFGGGKLHPECGCPIHFGWKPALR